MKEKRIQEVLGALNLKYIKQYKFKDCRNKLPLPFDFCIFLNNKKIILIEFDGEQHFIFSTNWDKTEEKFKKRQLNDKKKTAYCELNNIPLLRIAYWDFDNIEQLILSFLKNYDNEIIRSVSN